MTTCSTSLRFRATLLQKTQIKYSCRNWAQNGLWSQRSYGPRPFMQQHPTEATVLKVTSVPGPEDRRLAR